MQVFSGLMKHGISAVVGFVLGLVAIAAIRPVTANGKILLLLTVISICVVLGALVSLAVRWLRRSEPRDE